MLAIDPAACTELAESLDPRIQKVSFRNVAGPSPWSPPPPEPASLSNGNRTAKLVEVVVFVDGRTETAGVLEFASVLAQEHGAHLTGVFTQPEPTVTRPEMFAHGGGIRDVIETHRAQLERIEAGGTATWWLSLARGLRASRPLLSAS